MANELQLDSDAMLVFFDELGKRVDKLKTSLSGMGDVGSRHMRIAGESAAVLDKQIASIAKNLLGPVGLAAGFYAVTKSLDSFAVGQLQLQNLARNTGFATANVLRLQAQFERAGMTAAEAGDAMGSIGSKLQDIQIFREGSPIFQQIAQGAPKLAETINSFMKMGDEMGALAAIQKSYNEGTERWKRYLEGVFGISRSGFEVMNDNLEDHVHLWTYSREEMRKYHVQWINVSNTFENIWGRISRAAIGALNEIGKEFEKQGLTAEGFSKGFEKNFDETVKPAIMRTVAELASIPNILAEISRWLEIPIWERSFGQMKPDKFKAPELSWGEWFKQKFGGGDEGELPKGARPRVYSPGDIKQEELETDSNRLLRDIRDIMQRGEIRALGPGGGGGGNTTGYPAGQSRRALLEGRGGGNYGTGYETRADRNKNPGNIKFGEFAKSQGATGTDPQGFAIFPDRETGFKAAEALLGSESYSGLTLGQIGQKWSGDPNWATTISKAIGMPVGAVPNVMQRRAIARMGLPIAEGSQYGGGAIPGDVLETAKKFALSGGPGAVFRFIRSQGYNVDSNWCGEFAAAAVKAAGGKPPANPEIASNWRHYGEEAAVPLPGDIAVRRGAATGATGSHVTVVESVGRGSFVGLGGNQGRPESEYGIGQYQFYRDQLDRSMKKVSEPPNGHLTADITFGHVPSGVETSVDGSGFKVLRVTSSKQNQKAIEGLMGPGDMMYTPWVP